MNKKYIKEYTVFRKNSNFAVKKIITKNEEIWVDDFMAQDDNGKKYCGNINIINVGYNFKDNLSKSLSNLSKYTFIFRGKKANSIEGLDAYNTRAANFYEDWRKNGVLYWQGKAIDRYSEEYQFF